MPILLDPQSEIELWLTSDADKPMRDRPVFIYRPLSLRQMRDIRAILNTDIGSDDDAEAEDRIVRVATIGLCGWRNMMDPACGMIEFDAAALDEILTMNELIELYTMRLNGSSPTDDEKKTSESSL